MQENNNNNQSGIKDKSEEKNTQPETDKKETTEEKKSFGQKIKSGLGFVGEKIVGAGTAENLKSESKKDKAKGIGKLGVIGGGLAAGIALAAVLGLGPIGVIALGAVGIFGAQQVSNGISKNSDERSNDRLDKANDFKNDKNLAEKQQQKLEKSASKKKKMAIGIGVISIFAATALGPIGLLGLLAAGFMIKKSMDDTKKAKGLKEFSYAKNDQEKDAALVKAGIIKQKDLNKSQTSEKEKSTDSQIAPIPEVKKQEVENKQEQNSPENKQSSPAQSTVPVEQSVPIPEKEQPRAENKQETVQSQVVENKSEVNRNTETKKEVWIEMKDMSKKAQNNENRTENKSQSGESGGEFPLIKSFINSGVVSKEEIKQVSDLIRTATKAVHTEEGLNKSKGNLVERNKNRNSSII